MAAAMKRPLWQKLAPGHAGRDSVVDRLYANCRTGKRLISNQEVLFGLLGT
ncbi:hypothetical protein RLPCCGM1_c1820 [Rhizobium leguminosarum bv. phaseoli CCGM1]|nr:hypothetical protein RLPCCGM1_c1820 [Rhizobium leguminosarum bv. phaseoli CCGM1]